MHIVEPTKLKCPIPIGRDSFTLSLISFSTCRTVLICFSLVSFFKNFCQKFYFYLFIFSIYIYLEAHTHTHILYYSHTCVCSSWSNNRPLSNYIPMSNYRTIPTTLLETLSSSSDRVTRCKFIDWFSYSLKAAYHISIPEKKAPWKEAIFILELIFCTNFNIWCQNQHPSLDLT